MQLPMATDAIGLRDEVARGFEYSHHRANTNTGKLLEVTSFAYSMIELLSEKGLISLEELDERKREVSARIAERFQQTGMGVVHSEPEVDKYQFGDTAEIDCESRLPICRAACCRLQFALSRQDVEEGVVGWEFGRPYMIKQGTDGYCDHLDREGCRCTVYDQRPVACRGYDCRTDTRIWADFEKRIPSPELERLFAPPDDRPPQDDRE